MKKMKFYESTEFTLNKANKIKGGKKIYVIFSTYGEREAGLIYSKIKLLNEKLGDFIDKIFLSHRREDPGVEELTEKKAREAFPDTNILICNSIDVPDMEKEEGKGADMRRSVYTINKSYKDSADEDDIVLIFLDSDVVTEFFGEHFVLGLAGAVLKGAEFSKASFWREMGRVKKYVAQPLFSLINHPKLQGLTDFAYPLSGEVAGTLKFFNSVNFWQIYGVETGINIDACFGDYMVADVNLGLYDHEHHSEVNIQKMSFGIMRTFLLKCVEYGIMELKDNAEIGNIFKASLIGELGKRQFMEFDLTEKRYEPVRDILDL